MSRRWLRGLVGVGLVGITLVAQALTAAPARAATPPADPAPSGPVVLIGVTGLRWSDVGTLSTPALWQLSRTAAVGQVVARSVNSRACPADGWLAVSSGARAADAIPVGCRTLTDPSALDGTARVTQWQQYSDAVAGQSYGARLGQLGDTLTANDVAAAAIGPGAAIALADSTGTVAGSYTARPEGRRQLTAAVRTALTGDRLVVVDAGTLRDPGYETVDPDQLVTPAPTAEPGQEATAPPGADAILETGRAEQAEAIDARVAAVLAGTAGTGATVLVVSLADSGTSALQLAAVEGPLPGGTATGLLTSASTRQPGLVQTADVLPTVLAELGLTDAAPSLSGSVIASAPGPATAAGRLAALADTDRLATQITRAAGGFSTRLMLAQLLLVAAAGLLLWWSGYGTRDGPARALLIPVLRGLRVGSVVLATAPLAAFCTRLVPWWRSDVPRAAFWLVIAGFVALVSLVALLGPWRRSRTGPFAVVAGLTFAVLAVDLALGGRLVVDSPLGAHRLLGARFYGASNQEFALLAVAGLVVAGLVARWLLARGRRTAAWVAVAGIGLVTVAVDGMPGMGSDFGGPPALLPAFALLTFVVAGRRVRWRSALVVLGSAALVVIAFAALDFARPAADRTHLGRFVATVVGGGLWPVLGRKVSTNLRLLTSWRYVLPTLGGTALTLAIVGGIGRWAPPRFPRPPLAGLVADEPLLRPTAAAVAVAMGLAFVVNDSGVVIPATGLALAVPCLVALAASWRLERLSAASAGATPPRTAADAS
ncbi:MAG: hypothetical protein KJ792_14850 [Actinobacteria bacterium]|nr:hypothetical protein [Actinomycetota bacterium]MCG2801813.1 hypothetical protein [Cellulomonas sp.]